MLAALLLGLALILFLAAGSSGGGGGWQNRLRFLKQYGGIFAVFASALLLSRNVVVAVATVAAYAFLFRSGLFSPKVQPQSAPASAPLSLDDAYAILGLNRGATREDVQSAYRNHMKRNHPDQGGSAYIATRLNEARVILLRHLQS